MIVQQWFDKELKIIRPQFFAFYNPSMKRWQIRLNKKNLPKYLLNDYLIVNYQTTVYANVEDDFDNPLPLDNRILYKIRLSEDKKKHIKVFLAAMDERNERKIAKSVEEDWWIGREFATSMWGHYREMFLDYGARGAR